MNSYKNTWARITGQWVGGPFFMVVAAMSAHAAGPTISPSNGLMTFPHVRVVSVPPPAANSLVGQMPTSQGSFKAFIDPATGQLVQPTAGAAAELDAAIQRQQQTLTGEQVVQKPVKITGPKGAIGIRLDPSQMNYVVARKNTDGALGVACVPGAQTALSAVRGTNATTTKSFEKVELK